MYIKSTIARRRLLGWVERRRYFRRFFEQVREKEPKDAEIGKAASVREKD